jgi:hypothetical protein
MTTFAPETGYRGLKCSVEKHLWRSGLTLAVYSKMFQVTHGKKGSGKWFGTLQTLADYFAAPYNSIWRATRKLLNLGFLEDDEPDLPKDIREMRKRDHDHKVYRVVPHKEWQASHPGQCQEREYMPWDSETGDPLAPRLWKVSNGRLKWFRNELIGLRRSGLSDDELVREWTGFKQSNEGWRAAKYRFIREMRNVKTVNT